jgi:hypothetical protein
MQAPGQACKLVMNNAMNRLAAMNVLAKAYQALLLFKMYVRADSTIMQTLPWYTAQRQGPCLNRTPKNQGMVVPVHFPPGLMNAGSQRLT